MIVQRPVTLDGWFSTALNVAGSFIGDPALGSQIGAQAGAGFAKISQDNQQIADTISPKVLAVLNNPTSAKAPEPAYASMAQQVAPAVAQDLLKAGYVFPPGTVGADMQKPSYFDAFGGQNATYVKIGAGVLGGWALLKVLKVI